MVANYVYCSSSASEFGDCYLFTFFSSSYCSGHQHDVGIKCLRECGKGEGEGRGGEEGRGVAEETGKEKGGCAERRGGRSQIELQ